MTPQEFPGANLRIGEGQSEYITLPGVATEDGIVITCWRPSLWDWLKVLFTRRVWLHSHTFGGGGSSRLSCRATSSLAWCRRGRART